GRMTGEAEQLLARGGIPDLDLSDVVESEAMGHRGDPSAIRAEGHARRCVAMTPAGQEPSAGRGVQETHRCLIADGGQGLAVRAEGEAIRTRPVPSHREELLSRPRVPNFDEPGEVDRGELLVVRAEDRAADLRRVTAQSQRLRVRGEIPVL